ncbi:MAG: ABC transporter ATP-binding protein [Gemmatimonadetes bacterium]|nr:ABC transporter ATP-binding protein [Gemmatimonadota bacterium]
MSAAIVRVEGLGKRFPIRAGASHLIRQPFRWTLGSHQVLDAVRFEVRPDECFGLLGPNGAGKTTLFKILSTLVLPDEGSADVAGHDVVSQAGAVRRALTPVIADERSLNWRLSGEQNLALYASLYGLAADAAAAEVRRLLAAVGLSETGSKMVGTYSSGMKQRLLIARALLSRPKVLLLDEPTRSLDPISARDFRRFLREEIIARQGCAVLLATHNSEEAFELCDRLAVLHRGRLVAQGTATELARQVGPDRLRVVVSEADRDRAHRLLERALEPEAIERVHETEHEEPGWVALGFSFPAGAEGTAALSERFARAGIAVAELTRVALPLADLIDRLVRGDER